MYFWPVRIDRRDGAAEKELTPTERRRAKFLLVPIPREQHTSSFRFSHRVPIRLSPGEPHPPKRRRDPIPRALRIPPDLVP